MHLNLKNLLVLNCKFNFSWGHNGFCVFELLLILYGICVENYHRKNYYHLWLCCSLIWPHNLESDVHWMHLQTTVLVKHKEMCHYSWFNRLLLNLQVYPVWHKWIVVVVEIIHQVEIVNLHKYLNNCYLSGDWIYSIYCNILRLSNTYRFYYT